MSFILQFENQPLMFKEYPTSGFAHPERAEQSVLEKDMAFFKKNGALNKIANAVSAMIVILNRQRQIVYANELFLQSFYKSDFKNVIGKRPGEALNCIRSVNSFEGCGTTEFCRTCGAVNAILESQAGKKSEKECRIMMFNNSALDLRITSTPYKKRGTEYTIFAINDISHEKRRQNLENVFFHDVLNSAGGILGLSGILAEIENRDELLDIAQTINRAAENMVYEIQSQRQLGAAERGDLIPNLRTVESGKILNDIAGFYSKNDLFRNKIIEIAPDSEEVEFITDPVILRRILGNMVKNALEASAPGSKVKICSSAINNRVRFSVYNSGFIDKDVQLQMFQRSFSTKGNGRGTGTYSMKLLGEKYLKGKVGFNSTPENGTTFFIDLQPDFPAV